ncbi:hypothetical protein ACVIIV_005204 [Bradyrhizobium sp. USDA 4354]
MPMRAHAGLSRKRSRSISINQTEPSAAGFVRISGPPAAARSLPDLSARTGGAVTSAAREVRAARLARAEAIEWYCDCSPCVAREGHSLVSPCHDTRPAHDPLRLPNAIAAGVQRQQLALLPVLRRASAAAAHAGRVGCGIAGPARRNVMVQRLPTTGRRPPAPQPLRSGKKEQLVPRAGARTSRRKSSRNGSEARLFPRKAGKRMDPRSVISFKLGALCGKTGSRRQASQEKTRS